MKLLACEAKSSLIIGGGSSLSGDSRYPLGIGVLYSDLTAASELLSAGRR